MITGDYHHTAIAVAKDVGMVAPEGRVVVIDSISATSASSGRQTPKSSADGMPRADPLRAVHASPALHSALRTSSAHESTPTGQGLLPSGLKAIPNGSRSSTQELDYDSASAALSADHLADAVGSSQGQQQHQGSSALTPAAAAVKAKHVIWQMHAESEEGEAAQQLQQDSVQLATGATPASLSEYHR